MEKFKNAFWNALIARLTILLEFEPGDAVQDGYFQYLDELRNGARRGTVKTEARRVAVGDEARRGTRIARKVAASVRGIAG